MNLCFFFRYQTAVQPLRGWLAGVGIVPIAHLFEVAYMGLNKYHISDVSASPMRRGL